MRAPWRIAEYRRVVVNLKSGTAVAGVLWMQRGELLVLRDATVHEPGAAGVPVDGEVIVERRDVNFVQARP